MARLLKSEDSLSEILVRSMSFLLGADEAMTLALNYLFDLDWEWIGWVLRLPQPPKPLVLPPQIEVGVCLSGNSSVPLEPTKIHSLTDHH